jgi:hypothetical protein
MEPQIPTPPMFDLDEDGHVRLSWPRTAGALHGLLTLDEALDLQFELATFLAQVETRTEETAMPETLDPICECATPGAHCRPTRLMN